MLSDSSANADFCLIRAEAAHECEKEFETGRETVAYRLSDTRQPVLRFETKAGVVS